MRVTHPVNRVQTKEFPPRAAALCVEFSSNPFVRLRNGAHCPRALECEERVGFVIGRAKCGCAFEFIVRRRSAVLSATTRCKPCVARVQQKSVGKPATK